MFGPMCRYIALGLSVQSEISKRAILDICFPCQDGKLLVKSCTLKVDLHNCFLPASMEFASDHAKNPVCVGAVYRKNKQILF